MTYQEATKAIKRGNAVYIRNALEKGLNPNLSNRYCWALLMIAAMDGNTSIGRLLIEGGAALDARNKFGDTALSLAADSGHPSFVKLLLDHGASLECHPNSGSLASHLDWAEKYCGVTHETMEKTRALFNAARQIRNKEPAS